MNKTDNENQFLIYQTENGEFAVDVKLKEETIWLTQKQMAKLFGVEVHTVNYHIKEIFKNKELQENAVIRKFRITASDGKKYDTNFYNLDAIISIGYRINSTRATQSFVDGNKRIASLLFILYLDKNERLFKLNGELTINDNALVALALLIAESDPKNKDLMVKLVVNLLKFNNN